jgi:GGDEF domain-containing protein
MGAIMKHDKHQSKNNKRSDYLQQDLGMFLFLSSLFVGIVMMILVPEDLKLEFIGMLLLTFFAVLFASYRFTIIAVVCAGLQVTVFTAYKLFYYYIYGEMIQSYEFVWLFYPLISVGAMTLFINRSYHLEMVNKVLRTQIDKLVLVDSLTGLYNLKCLYLDLETQAALAARRGTEITLMIIAFRYEKELRKILGSRNFDTLRQQVAYVVQDCLRIEDKLYVIDDNGSLAVILTCNKEGADIVKNRIKKSIGTTEILPEIIRDRVIKVDLRISALQYDIQRFGQDVMKYKDLVESELQYDV